MSNVETVTDIIREEGGDLLESVQVFDLYEGERIEQSKKAVSFKITFRSNQRTLDGEKINRLYEAIVKKNWPEDGRYTEGGLIRYGPDS